MNPSFVHGVGATPLKYQTIGEALDEAAATWGSREALVVRHQNVRWTYTELKERAEALGAGLLSLGLQPGDRVGIWAPNCSEWAVTQFATAKAGLILVNINPAYRVAELEFALNKVGCKALVTAPSFKTSDYLGMLASLEGRLPHLQWKIRTGQDRTPGFRNLDELYDGSAALPHGLQPDDAINIQFTSGTTGLPKGATLSHFNILNNGYFVARAMRLSERDRMCIPVPLYHCFGMVMGNLGCLTHGAAMVYPNDGFDPRLTLEAVAQERCTVLYGVPTMFIAELEHPQFATFDLTSLRTGIMAGAPCPIEVMKRVIKDMHMREVTIAYGMTETSPVSFQSSVDDRIERRVSTVGRVLPHIQVKIIDTQGRVVPRGTQGELCTRGYSVMQGYWDDAQKTREVLDDAGWMHTGDLATIDDEGYCNITGRLKDLVIRGGENISPREVEDFLYRHPKVQGVQVFGVPDPKYGEEVCAWIQLRPGASASEEEIRDFCRGQIAHQKVPRYVRFVSEFPMTVTGKAQKFVMRSRMMQELGVRQEATA
ncbi:MAG TPA: AMP-binding protein [Burkholderiales bacterium]|nr:AMP-binding protein [Burkholderiales bacterium]